MTKVEMWLDQNNSLHLQQVRYGSGYYCAGIEDGLREDEAIEQFYGLICGDMDYFEALEWFENTEGMYLAKGDSLREALANCEKMVEDDFE
jgi:hypothetical protein